MDNKDWKRINLSPRKNLDNASAGGEISSFNLFESPGLIEYESTELCLLVEEVYETFRSDVYDEIDSNYFYLVGNSDVQSTELRLLIEGVYQSYRSDFYEEIDYNDVYLMENSDLRDSSSPDESKNDHGVKAVPSIADHVKLMKRNCKRRFSELEDIPLEMRVQAKRNKKSSAHKRRKVSGDVN